MTPKTMLDGRIVEDSYYDHSEHGRVKVLDVTKGVVTMQKQNEYTAIAGGGERFLSYATQSAVGFREDAEPADVTVNADLIVIDSDSTDPTSQ